MNVNETGNLTIGMIVMRLVLAGVVGAVIGYERRAHHKSIGVAGMTLVCMGSAAYMLLAKHLSVTDPGALGRALQGILQGIGFLGGAVIFKGGTDVRGIKTAASVWIAGVIGMSIGTWFWWLGVIVGGATGAILLVTDMLTPKNLEEHVEAQQQKIVEEQLKT